VWGGGGGVQKTTFAIQRLVGINIAIGSARSFGGGGGGGGGFDKRKMEIFLLQLLDQAFLTRAVESESEGIFRCSRSL
jgi:hypothetical protein